VVAHTGAGQAIVCDLFPLPGKSTVLVSRAGDARDRSSGSSRRWHTGVRPARLTAPEEIALHASISKIWPLYPAASDVRYGIIMDHGYHGR
jgi:hypothetical protein